SLKDYCILSYSLRWSIARVRALIEYPKDSLSGR
uniref:Uncharacterized protein n=2 Tax=Parascaris univalens TaxID=6257 RepID=A0A915A3M0_PARUN